MTDRPEYRFVVEGDSMFGPTVKLQRHCFGPFYSTLDSRYVDLCTKAGEDLKAGVQRAKDRLIEAELARHEYTRQYNELDFGVQPVAALHPPCRHSHVEPVYSGLFEKELVALICLNPECGEQLEVHERRLESS